VRIGRKGGEALLGGGEGVKSVHIKVLPGYLYYLLCSQTRFCAS